CQVATGQVVGQDVQGGQMIDGNVEETLDLTGVQVDGYDPVDAGSFQQVGNQLGGNRFAGLDLLVLPGVAEVGDDCVDTPGRGAAQRIGHDEQLHQVVVDR